MNYGKSRLLSVSLAFGLIAPSGWADVTPNDVWSDWRDYMQALGYTLTGTQAAQGDILALSDLRLTSDLGADQGSVSVSLGSATLRQLGDGTVTVALPDTMNIIANIMPAEGTGDPATLGFSMAQRGQNMIVSGTPANMTSAFQADELTVTLTEMTVDGETFGDENAMMRVVATDIGTTSVTQIGQLRDLTQTSAIGGVSYEMRFKNPDEPAIAAMSGAMTDLRAVADTSLPLGLVQANDTSAMLRAGLDVVATLSNAAGNFNLAITDPRNGDSAIGTTSAGSTLKMETGAEGISYAGTQRDVTLAARLGTLPVPVDVAMETVAFNVTAPATTAQTPQDIALGLTMGGVTMSDLLWGLIDPTGTLPRDPATVMMDMSGKATLLVDYLDPTAMEDVATADGSLGSLNALDLNAFVIDLAGARLTATGALNFEADAEKLAPGIPAPSGAIDMALAGGTTLLDRLGQIGIVPPPALMSARFMLGMFAVPGEKPDTLISKIEFTRSGAILANGQRIK